MKPALLDNREWKALQSDSYNFVFNKKTGAFFRWGATRAEDPQWSALGPEIADIEISKDGCLGFGTKERPQCCRYCYKANTSAKPYNMTLAEFKTILAKLGPQLTQVAFGITSLHANPDFFAMMAHCRMEGVIPNFTLSGSDMERGDAERIANLVGAVAVSYHGDMGLCLNTVEALSRAGVCQVNIHAVTLDPEALKDLAFELQRWKDRDCLNALVLLSLKPKGRAKDLKNISDAEFTDVVSYARDKYITLGFDSCSAHRAMTVFEEKFHTMIEPCESGLFSSYIDAHGRFHPCSFAEGEWGHDGIDVLACDNFLMDVWMSEPVQEWRRKLLANGRRCPLEFK